MAENKITIEGQKFYFTTDLKQNSDTLENSLTTFGKNEGSGKFEVKNVKFKILE